MPLRDRYRGRITEALFAAVFFIAAEGAFFAACASELSALCARGEFLAVRDLLEGGANPNETDGQGYTPLMRTVLAGAEAPLSMHLKIADLLIQAGADLNASAAVLPSGDDNPVSTMAALHWAVSKGINFLEMTLLLLEKGADPNLPGALGRPLHIASGTPDASAEHVRLLLERGADVRAVNQWGVTPLVEAVTGARPSPEKIALLLEAGADANVTFDWGEHHGLDVLMAAAMNGTPETVRLLLDHGALRSSQSQEGLTAYDYALLAERADNAALLR